MEDMRVESPKPKIGVIVIGVLASAIIFGGLGYYIGSMDETAPAGTMTYASPSASTAVSPKASSSASTSTDTKSYTNAKHGYSFSYPASSTLTESDSGIENGGSLTIASLDKDTNSIYFAAGKADLMYIEGYGQQTVKSEKITVNGIEWSVSEWVGTNTQEHGDNTKNGGKYYSYTKDKIAYIIHSRYLLENKASVSTIVDNMVASYSVAK